MGKRLYVGNLPYSVNEQDLTEKFGAFGTVETATLITDRDTGRSKGFGFVEMGPSQKRKPRSQKSTARTTTAARSPSMKPSR